MHTVRESQGGSLGFRKVRKGQGTFSLVWKNVCLPEKVKEFRFILDICVTLNNDCA